MGVDLYSEHGYQALNWYGWGRCFDIAIEHGWHPAGTEPPDDHVGAWGGGYFSNDYQHITDGDARAFGEALLRGIPIEEARERDSPTRWPDNSFHRFREFAGFALKGGFKIG